MLLSMRIALRMLLAALLTVSAIPAQLVISQVYGGGGNSGATLTHDFIEIFNPTANPVTVSGWSVQYASAAGTTWQVTPLSGTVQPGRYYLIQQAQGAAGTVSLPAPDATGTIPMSATAGKVALVSSTAALSGTGQLTPPVVDFVGYGTANFFEGSAAAPGLSNTTAALRNGAGCIDTNQNSLDFTSGAPNPRKSASPQQLCAAPPPPPPFLTISQIQGSGGQSPYVAQRVETRGVVTARKFNGFFIQTPDPEADNDPATSEGLFVFTSSTPPADAAVGNLLSVTGTVTEFRPASDPAGLTLTELTNATLSILSTANPLPAAVTLTNSILSAAGGIEQLERFEGMRVTVPSLTVVSPTDGIVNETNATATSNGVFYGVLTGVARPFREPGVDVHETLPAGSPCCVPRFDANPETLRVDSDALLGTTATNVSTGAVVANLTGPLDYSPRAYTLLADGTQTVLTPGLAAAIPVPAPTSGEVTVASFNMERFFDTVNDPGISDAVLTPAAFLNRLNKASLAIRNVLRMPDVIVVEEVENLATLEAIAAKVNQDAGSPNPNYQAFLAEGNDPGGIDVGVLVKGSNSSVLELEQVGKTAVFLNPANGQPETLHDRPPFLVRVAVSRPGLPAPVEIAVLGNHFRSLNGISDPADGARVRAKRKAQAEAVAQWVHERQLARPDENLVVLGDFNAFEFSDGYVDLTGTVAGTPAAANTVVLGTNDLVNPDLTNLITRVPPANRYSYLFQGSAQVLDQVLVNRALAARFSRIHFARSNADFPEVLRGDANRPERLSDHDMPVAYFLGARNVTQDLDIEIQAPHFVPGLDIWRSELRIKNRTGAALPGPVQVVIGNLPAGVTLRNASGQIPAGPYVTLTSGLKANATQTLKLDFSGPASVPLSYSVTVFQGSF